jgi:type II secretion system protein N
MALPIRLPNLGPRSRKIARIAGYVLLALVTFVLALQLTFPYDRVKTRIEEALAEKYQVSIRGVERGWVPGRVYFNSVVLTTRQTKPDEQPTTIYIDRLGVDVDFLPLLRGAASVNLDVRIGGGRVHGNLTLSKDGTKLAFEGSDVQSQMLPMREVIGLPMSGILEFDVALDLPNEKSKSGKTTQNWQKAEGDLRIACPSSCTFGDGKTKLKTKLKNARSQAFAADGIDFGKVTLKSLLAKVEIKTGTLTLTQFEAPSDDGTLHVDYAMELQPSLNDSMVTGCLRFNGSPGLLQRDAKTFSALTATGAQLGPDNLFHIRLTDKFKDMKRLPQSCGPGISNKAPDSPGSPSRPVLNVQPEEAARDAGVPPPTFTPPTAPPGTPIDAAAPPPPPAPPEPTGSAAAGSAGPATPAPVELH